jgi:hypothetical protein
VPFTTIRHELVYIRISLRTTGVNQSSLVYDMVNNPTSTGTMPLNPPGFPQQNVNHRLGEFRVAIVIESVPLLRPIK